MERTLTVMLFLSKEMDSNSSKRGGNTRQHSFLGWRCPLWQPHFVEDVATYLFQGLLFFTGYGRSFAFLGSGFRSW